jgi:acetylornithine/succinyldiaminopimelate/putrescine aminotransferase
MGFHGSNHGQGLAMSQFAHPTMSLKLGWPVLEYPSNEEQSLEEARKTLKSNKISAVVIEPTNWQTGLVASDSYIIELGKLAKESGAALIVDETNTGCGASGKSFW